jgi:hypothetical protein
VPTTAGKGRPSRSRCYGSVVKKQGPFSNASRIVLKAATACAWLSPPNANSHHDARLACSSVSSSCSPQPGEPSAPRSGNVGADP